MSKKLITIGIPTFNRREIILKHINYLLKLNLPTFVDVLIIDNNSSDGSYDAVRSLVAENDNFKLLKNNENIGVAKSFIKLFNETSSEYLIFTSDEDFVLMDQMIELKKFIENKSPSFISSQMYLNNGRLGNILYRGKENISLIDPSEAREASFYSSGTVYKISECRDVLKSIDDVVDTNEFAHLYPQVLLTTLLLARGVGFYYDKPLTEKKYEGDSHISTLNNSSGYWNYGSRRLQYIEHLSFLKAASAIEKNTDIQNNLLSAITSLEKSLESSVTLWILVNNPNLVTIFESRKYIRMYFHMIKRGCYLTVVNPSSAMKKIGKIFSIMKIMRILKTADRNI